MSKTVPDWPTEEMILAGAVAIQEHYRLDGGWCGVVAAQEQAMVTWQAMLAAAKRYGVKADKIKADMTAAFNAAEKAAKTPAPAAAKLVKKAGKK